MISVKYKFDMNQRIVTPFAEEGIITMLGFDDGGNMYYVKTKENSSWHKEKELNHIPIVDRENE